LNLQSKKKSLRRVRRTPPDAITYMEADLRHPPLPAPQGGAAPLHCVAANGRTTKLGWLRCPTRLSSHLEAPAENGTIAEGSESILEDAEMFEDVNFAKVLRRKRPLIKLPWFRRRKPDKTVRLAVMSSPRSGGTWLRLLLEGIYAVPGLSVPNPAALDWQSLPSECVLHMHWHRTPALARMLDDEGFRVVSVIRHPLDLLVSVLQFCLHDDSPLQWLGGENGDERSIRGVLPNSPAFIRYACGPRAAALMDVNREWRPAPGALQVRYEELVADTPRGLRRIEATLGKPTRRPAAAVAADATIPQLRKRTGVAHHFWQGRPGLWKQLLTAPAAERIALAHSLYCAELRYACHPDLGLTAAQADANWLALVRPPPIAE
jgi:Sulfotransferase domain